ncbi:Uncharacterized protein PECH_005894 [Penicillium ucsense]|uniref:SET domain-containing protein n=1 Tax=Penicillium ucsense TaxID=2839758 RepID=A0A8J8W5X2_9EURO|nr:Uncharacterized protein PECM_000693 [Penicillium ucsense]KAF7736076.1 Uncharacterized protein PECH_005894 [Penicillium ucsense]
MDKAKDETHPYLRLKIPESAPYELKPSGDHGWGGFATRFIAKGSLIYREQALFTLQPRGPQQVNDYTILWEVRQLSAQDKETFNLIVKAAALEGDDKVTDVFIKNYFRLANVPNELGLPTRSHHLGFFVFLSRLNHACVANAYIPQNEGKYISCYATKDIQPGEEIMFSYCADFESMQMEQRHRLLKFTCKCVACAPGTAFHELSEIRRKLIRGLNFLTQGMDFAYPRRDGHGPSGIIADPVLREAAKELFMPLMSRLFYESMIGLLLEEEGMMNAIMEKEIIARMRGAVRLLREPDNAVLALRIMEQKRWIDKWLVASRTLHKPDLGDIEGYLVLNMTRTA